MKTIILLSLLLTSCAVERLTQEEQVPFIYTVTWCNEKHVYLKHYFGEELRIKNADKELFFVDDTLILKEEFQIFYK